MCSWSFFPLLPLGCIFPSNHPGLVTWTLHATRGGKKISVVPTFFFCQYFSLHAVSLLKVLCLFLSVCFWYLFVGLLSLISVSVFFLFPSLYLPLPHQHTHPREIKAFSKANGGCKHFFFACIERSVCQHESYHLKIFFSTLSSFSLFLGLLVLFLPAFLSPSPISLQSLTSPFLPILPRPSRLSFFRYLLLPFIFLGCNSFLSFIPFPATHYMFPRLSCTQSSSFVSPLFRFLLTSFSFSSLYGPFSIFSLSFLFLISCSFFYPGLVILPAIIYFQFFLIFTFYCLLPSHFPSFSFRVSSSSSSSYLQFHPLLFLPLYLFLSLFSWASWYFSIFSMVVLFRFLILFPSIRFSFDFTALPNFSFSYLCLFFSVLFPVYFVSTFSFTFSNLV